jgi:hypothetical protein
LAADASVENEQTEDILISLKLTHRKAVSGDCKAVSHFHAFGWLGEKSSL